MCLHHNHCVTIQARNIFIFMLALLQAKKRPHLCDPSSNHSNQPQLRLYPKVSSGHHKHDRNNREQSNHAYYQIFSHHPNTSSGHWLANHASCTSAACYQSPCRIRRFYSSLLFRSAPRGDRFGCLILPAAYLSSSAGVSHEMCRHR